MYIHINNNRIKIINKPFCSLLLKQNAHFYRVLPKMTVAPNVITSSSLFRVHRERKLLLK